MATAHPCTPCCRIASPARMPWTASISSAGALERPKPSGRNRSRLQYSFTTDASHYANAHRMLSTFPYSVTEGSDLHLSTRSLHRPLPPEEAVALHCCQPLAAPQHRSRHFADMCALLPQCLQASFARPEPCSHACQRQGFHSLLAEANHFKF